MPTGRSLGLEGAKKLVHEVAGFEYDPSGVADFVIRDAKEALLLSAYTSAMLLFNDQYGFKLRAIDGGFSSPGEPVYFGPYGGQFGRELIPIFQPPASKYVSLIGNDEPKYLFIGGNENYLQRPPSFYDSEAATSFFHERLPEAIHRRALGAGIKPTQCLVWPSIDGEDFWEYLSALILRREGYLVSFYGFTTPDIYGYGIPDLVERLVRAGLSDGGFLVEELEMMPCRHEPPSSEAPIAPLSAVVVEAESTDSNLRTHGVNAGAGHIRKYLTSWRAAYTGGVLAGPYTTGDEIECQDPRCHCHSLGLISCNENGGLVFKKPKFSGPTERTKANLESIRLLAKGLLLKNLNFEKRCELLSLDAKNISEYYDRALNVELEKVIQTVARNAS
jgi:hypothetical protein